MLLRRSSGRPPAGRCCIEGLVDVSRAFLPDLLSTGHGALIDVASNAGYQPMPGMAGYAATKAFVLNFTEALWHELKGTECGSSRSRRARLAVSDRGDLSASWTGNRPCSIRWLRRRSL